MSRTKLAEFIGAKPNSMVRYEKAGENGGKYPSLQMTVRICRVLEIDPRHLFQRVMEFDNPVYDLVDDRDSEPAKRSFNFRNHFKSEVEFLSSKMSVRNIEELNNSLLCLQAEIFYLGQKIEPEEGSGPIQIIEPSRPSHATNQPEAVPPASDHHSMSEAKRNDPG